MAADKPLTLPPDDDLRRLIHFSAGDGRIWLAGHRMLLLHLGGLANLRKELIQTIGVLQTRRVLKRAGYESGVRDAALARQVRPNADPMDQFSVGPQLHMLEGAVQVTPEMCEFNAETGAFHGIFRWDQSWEVETHVRDFGPQTDPVCWMLIGYASGYTSAFFGKQILFKEVQCAACGQDHCRIEGLPLEEWPDADAMMEDYRADSLLVRIEDLQADLESLRVSLAPSDDLGDLIGRSKAFEKSIGLLRKAASTQVTVLLTGETGVGKERFARTLHAMSPRAEKPFVAINCAALPHELIESELFGAEKGAFTGAGAARPGRFERADGGTLFLDELGELPLAAQAKLLRVLQTGEVERLGATATRKVDVRVVAATNVDLEAAVEAGRFRRDLMYRLNVYPIAIPPLRDRVEDIEPLAHHMLRQFMVMHNKRVAGITDRALDAMRGYAWPGNVRELENLIERGLIMTSPGQMVDVDDLFAVAPAAPSVTLSATGELKQAMPGDINDLFNELQKRGLSLDALEDALIRQAVERAGGNLSAAARSLGLTRPQLSYRLQKVKGD
jgi:DNA-binding NtrC family response regulator/predicted hydrocarbon binding protein